MNGGALGGHTIRDPIPQFNARCVALSRHLYRTLHLHPMEHPGGTFGAALKVRSECLKIRGIKFAVDVGVESAAPFLRRHLLTGHAGLPWFFSANRAGFCGHAIVAT